MSFVICFFFCYVRNTATDNTFFFSTTKTAKTKFLSFCFTYLGKSCLCNILKHKEANQKKTLNTLHRVILHLALDAACFKKINGWSIPSYFLVSETEPFRKLVNLEILEKAYL